MRVGHVAGLIAFAAISLTLLTDCSIAPAVEAGSVDYSTTIENVANISLATNVLRARDAAPLYFPDLSQVRGSMTVTAAMTGTIPWKGPSTGSTQIGALSAQTNPTFDIAPSNTKQFYQGLLNPISENIFAYFIERGRGYGSAEFAFHLLVSGIEVSRPVGKSRHTDFYAWNDKNGGAEFLKIADRWFETYRDHEPIVYKTKGSSKNVGPPVEADAKAIVQANSAGLEVHAKGTSLVQFVKSDSGGKVICFFDGEAYTPVSIVDNSVVKGPAGEQRSNGAKPTTQCPGGSDNIRYALHLRSVEQIFYYLGSVIADDANPLPLRQSGPHEGCPRIPFYISPSPTGFDRFSISYRGSFYYVADISHKVTCPAGKQKEIFDSTMPILAILNDLLNLNRDANEVPTTKAVQAVGGG